VLHSLPEAEVHTALKKIGHKRVTANCRADVGPLVSVLYFVAAHSGQEESMFLTKHRGRTIGLLTVASSLFSGSNRKHRSVLLSLTQRNESPVFHTVALATFWGLRNNAPTFLAFHEPPRRGFPFARFAKISTSQLGS
jgi:hypothetical protein